MVNPFLRTQKAVKAKAKKKAADKSEGFFIQLVFSACGIRLVTEHMPFSDRKHRIDFAYPDLKIAIEKEGGLWMAGGGAHSRPQNIERDIYKYTRLAVEGWIVIRRQPKQMNTVETLDLIKSAIALRNKSNFVL